MALEKQWFELDALRPWAVRTYVATGMAEGDAETVVENQLWSDLRGIDTHGLWRLPWYCGWFAEGKCDPTTQLAVVKETPTSIAADGQSGLGQLVITRMIERLIPKALESGMCIGTVRNSNDWGCGANYPYKAAEAGLCCIATTTSVPNIAPYGSRKRLFGNNPIVFAVPRREHPPLIHDFALTPVALGKVMRAREEEAELPLEWGFKDNEGEPTTNPRDALRGIIPAIGEYKGTNLAMMTNVFAGIMSGSSHSAAVDVGRRGQMFILMRPDLFTETDTFLDEVESMIDQIREAGKDTVKGAQVFLPGELEEATMAERKERGAVAYPGSVVGQLQETGEGLGVPFDLSPVE